MHTVLGVWAWLPSNVLLVVLSAVLTSLQAVRCVLGKFVVTSGTLASLANFLWLPFTDSPSLSA